MDDSSFGPGRSDQFDFTLLFEHAFLHIVPSIFMILTVPYHINKILKGPVLVRPGKLLWVKLGAAVAIAAIQLTGVVLWYKSPLNSAAAQAASVLSFLSALGTIIIGYSSHTHFLQPIFFLAFYLIVTLLFDLVTVYSYWHRDSLHAVARLACALPPLKLILIALEEVSKRSLVVSKEAREACTNESMAGFWNRSTFAWVNPLLIFGFRHRIKNNHLPDIGVQFDAEAKYYAFKQQWDKQDKKDKYALLKACIFSDPWPYVYILLPRLFLIVLLVSEPFLLQDIVDTVSGSSHDNLPSQQKRTGLILAVALVFIGKAIAQNCYSHIENQIRVSIRGTLITAIYQKSLTISAGEAEELAAITLMSADVGGIEHLISLCYDSWALILETACGVTILSFFVGAASIITVIVATAAAAASRYMTKKIGNTRKLWNGHMEDRVAMTSNILAQIREIKMLGLAPSMSSHLQRLHDKEIEVSLTDRRILCIIFGITAFAEAVSPALVIAATLFWTRASQSLSTGRFFATLALVNLVSLPLSDFLYSLSTWSSGFACVSRIQEYLSKPDATDPRQFLQPTQGSTSGRSSTRRNLRNRRRREAPVPFLIQFQDAVISLDKETDPILRNVNVCIYPGEVTMVYGSVGSGKSTFLKALLGEVLLDTGSITISSLSVAYAAQQHFLINATIRVNIIGNQPYDHILYQKVIFICALDIDIQQLSNGDQTIVGNAGSNLSGGQKQRISLARALYFEADITILDDPFSSLDKETSTLVRTRLLSEGHATADGRSLIMTTSMQQHLVDAHNVLRISDNGYVKQVPLEEVDAGLQDISHRTQSPRTSKIEPMGSGLQELPTVKATSTNDVNDDEQSPAPQGDWSLYAYYLSPAGSWRIIFFLIADAISSLAEQLPIIFVRIWLGIDPGNYRYYIGFAVISIFYPISTSFSSLVFFYTVSARAASGLHRRLSEATFGATFEFLMNEDAGSVVNRFSLDMSMATQRIAALVLPTVFRGTSIIVQVGIISAGATYAAPIIPLFIFLAVAIQQYYLRTSRQLHIQELDSSKNLVQYLTETAAGIQHIRAFRWQDDVLRKFHNILSLTQRPVYFLYCVKQWLQGVMRLSTAFAAIAMVSLALNFPSTASGPSMGLALLSLISFSRNLSDFILCSVALETAFGAVSRIRSYADSTPSEQQPGTSPAPPGWPSLGRVELRNVSAVYKPRNAAAFCPAGNLSVIVQPGETLGLVGRTGSGKSTVLLTILNLLEYSGSIVIDGCEIRSMPAEELRARITTITQHGIHLRGSVSFNLDPFDASYRPPGYTMTPAMQEIALRRVGLWDIVCSRGDLTTSMKDMKLSHGQKQLLQIARAILHKQATGSRVLLMDEGTASLDEGTEWRINRLLDEEFSLCTKIVISHRTSTLEGADAVMTLKDGQATVARYIAVTGS